MFNPIRYVDNNFEDPKLSDANLRAFSEDFLVRLAQPENNPGSIYSTLLTDTTTKYTAYYGKMSSQAVKEAIAEGATITRNNARKAAYETIDAMQGFAKLKYGELSDEFQQLYPLGMTEYYKAREGDVGTLFDRFVTAATSLLNADYPAEVTLVTNKVTAFHSAYTARETIVSQVDVTITGKNTDRIALTAQLTKNFLIIGSNNVGNPDKFDDYYDARFLPIESSGTRLIVREITIAPGATGNISLTGIDADKIASAIFQSTGSNGQFHSSTTNNGGPAGGVYLVNNGDSLEKTSTQIETDLNFSEINQYLNVLNTGLTPGTYKVTFTVED